MTYLIIKLLPYLALAFTVGLTVGWYSCPGVVRTSETTEQ